MSHELALISNGRQGFHDTTKRRHDVEKVFRAGNEKPLTPEEIELLKDIGRIRTIESLPPKNTPTGENVVRSKNHLHMRRRDQSSSLGLILQYMEQSPSSPEYISPLEFIGDYDLQRLHLLSPGEWTVLEGLVATYGGDTKVIADWIQENTEKSIKESTCEAHLISAGLRLHIPSRVHMAIVLKAFQLQQKAIDRFTMNVFGSTGENY